MRVVDIIQEETKLYEKFTIPEFVYVPFDDKTKIVLNKESNVFCNNKLCEFKNKDILSTVSGKAIGIKKMNSSYGIIDTLVVENNFRDKKEKILFVKKSIVNFSYSFVSSCIISPTLIIIYFY